MPEIHVSDFCLALQNLEGYYAPCAKFPQGSAAWRNRNPGNIRCNSVKHRLAEGCSPDGFCIFPDYATGFLALEENIINVVKGHARPYGYNPEMSLIEFFEHRDPASDGNNPLQCAMNVANYLRCSIHYQLKDLIIDAV